MTMTRSAALTPAANWLGPTFSWFCQLASEDNVDLGQPAARAAGLRGLAQLIWACCRGPACLWAVITTMKQILRRLTVSGLR